METGTLNRGATIQGQSAYLFRRNIDMAKHTELEMRCDGRGGDLFMLLDGVTIAKRGRPGTPQAGQWVSLEPAIQST
jgi:hypothetical protein